MNGEQILTQIKSILDKWGGFGLEEINRSKYHFRKNGNLTFEVRKFSKNYMLTDLVYEEEVIDTLLYRYEQVDNLSELKDILDIIKKWQNKNRKEFNELVLSRDDVDDLAQIIVDELFTDNVGKEQTIESVKIIIQTRLKERL